MSESGVTKIKRAKNNTMFSISYGVHMYFEKSCNSVITKKDFKFKKFSRRLSESTEDEIIDEKLRVLTKVEKRYHK